MMRPLRVLLPLLILCSSLLLQHISALRLHSSLKLSIPSHDIKDRVLLYNSLTKRKEIFQSIEPNKVTFYSCGPTVYDFAHIGNFRAFLTYDILKRWLLYCGYECTHICNLTDVDDKIILKMKAENKSLKEITELYSQAFFDDLSVLNILPANKYPKATEHISDIIHMISSLLSKDFAYVESGSVYFRVNAFASYGEMVNLEKIGASELKEGAGERGPNERKGKNEKENERDFVLWKAFSEGDGEVVWDSPFGRGRPGWHIECSAMIHSLLGSDTIDLHAGGVDLMFPHHTNEIAQSEAFSGKKMCNCWVHNGFVNINNEKMSKSLRNFKTLRDIATNPFDARAFRFMIVSAQYRSALNFTPETFAAAVSSLRRIDKAVQALRERAAVRDNKDMNQKGEEEVREDLVGELVKLQNSFESALCDDVNTPRAIATVFSLISMAEKVLIASPSLSSASARLMLELFERMDAVLGLVYEVPKAYFGENKEALPIPDEIFDLARKRASFKASKMYAEADEVRRQISEAGFLVKDVKGGEFEVLRI